MLDCKGFGTKIGRETRENEKKNEKLSLGMADNCVFSKKTSNTKEKWQKAMRNEQVWQWRQTSAEVSHVLHPGPAQPTA